MLSFSEPGEGIHSVRIFNLALVDIILTALFAYIISSKHFLATFIVLIVLGIIIHRIVGVKTPLNKWLY